MCVLCCHIVSGDHKGTDSPWQKFHQAVFSKNSQNFITLTNTMMNREKINQLLK